MVNIEIVFKNGLLNVLKDNKVKYVYGLKKLKVNEKNMDNIKAIALNDNVFINLSSKLWKHLLYDENEFIKYFTKTVVHENIHALIDKDYDDFVKGQEKVCMILANQRLLKNEKFK